MAKISAERHSVNISELITDETRELIKAMDDCPECHFTAHARTSRYITANTKERYHQCTNINRNYTFVTMETVDRFIVTSGKINPGPPHPANGGQQAIHWM